MSTGYHGVSLSGGVLSKSIQDVANVLGKEPEEGDWWWVKFPGEIALAKAEVSYISPMIVTLWYSGGGGSTYKRCDVDMVEECVS